MKENKCILGIETSCDDTSVSIIKDEILCHLSFSQIESLKHWGGVVPEIAARNHLEKISPLLQEAFQTTQLTPQDIDLIAVTGFPGLLGPLLTGMNAAKTLSLLYKKPILPVNHLHAHLEAIHLTEDIEYPYLGILLSGGHSLFILVQSKGEFINLGGTIDDAAGEAFDKGGKLLGLGYPAGHIIDQLSGFGDPKKYEFPIGLKASANCNLSYSGIKTALKVFIEKNPNLLDLKPEIYQEFNPKSQMFYDTCASYQDAIVAAISLKLRYALKKLKEEYQIQNIPLVVGGGVACNSHLRKQLNDKYKDVHFVKPEFCTDNGAMIANYGKLYFDQKIEFPECLELDSKSRFINKKEFMK